MEERAVAAEIKWEWIANDTKWKTSLQNVLWIWICGYSQNTGTEVVHGMEQMHCFNFGDSNEKWSRSIWKKIFDHERVLHISYTIQYKQNQRKRNYRRQYLLHKKLSTMSITHVCLGQCTRFKNWIDLFWFAILLDMQTVSCLDDHSCADIAKHIS
jgi:hypothetical protein